MRKTSRTKTRVTTRSSWGQPAPDDEPKIPDDYPYDPDKDDSEDEEDPLKD
jgi:hypothetical protein